MSRKTAGRSKAMKNQQSTKNAEKAEPLTKNAEIPAPEAVVGGLFNDLVTVLRTLPVSMQIHQVIQNGLSELKGKCLAVIAQSSDETAKRNGGD